MGIKEYLRDGTIKKTKISKELAHSLINMSKHNEEAVKSLLKMSSTYISPQFALAYDSLREILEAVCIMRGYKVISHIALGELVKSLYTEFDFNTFDRVRWIRNGIQYYGQSVDYDSGKELINKMLELKNKMLVLLEEEIKR